ncbi:MAG: secondary thiamine-phosphate synthase enzyme YjbQ [Candidatus Omnitrophota bacterium]
MDIIKIITNKRNEFIDITTHLQGVVKDSKVKDGMCVVFCPHTTAGLTINENADSSVQHDILKHLAEVIPQRNGFTHSEGNSDAHIKSSLVGCSLNIFIEDNGLKLGVWQGVYFCEFDGPRSREVWVKIM